MPLPQTLATKALPRDKIYRMYDAGGLYLEISPRGGKWWRMKYRLSNREKRLSLGVFPIVCLKRARAKLQELRTQIRSGLDPSIIRRTQKLAARSDPSFEAIAREWIDAFSRNWALSYADKVVRRLELYIFPWLGSLPIHQIKAVDLMKCLHRLEARGAHETARRTLQACGRVLRYSIATGRLEVDVSRHVRGALARREKRHLASITDPKSVAALLRATDGYEGRMVTRAALRVAPLVFVRPGELR